jgi:hypothetical protein
VGCVPAVVVPLLAGTGGVTASCKMFPNDSWNFPCRRRAVLHITMDTTYQNLSRKLDTLRKHQHHISTNTAPKYTLHKSLTNLTNVDFNTEQIRTLNLGFPYAIEKHSSNFTNALIVETETVIRHLDPSLQNTY